MTAAHTAFLTFEGVFINFDLRLRSWQGLALPLGVSETL